MSGSTLDILVPTCDRPAALAVTLAGLALQQGTEFNVIVSDQSDHEQVFAWAEVQTAVRLLRQRGHSVRLGWHHPRRGMAEHRDHLLRLSGADRVLFLDDDLLLEPWVVSMMMRVLDDQRCGFVGSAPIGLSYADDERPHEQWLEQWEDGRVRPERVVPGDTGFNRYPLHNAANVLHVQRQLHAHPDKPILYRVSWVGGCVLYDATALRQVGGFGFWRDLPAHHAGEDVLAELRVMERFGGCGVLPSGVYHQELRTTLPERDVDAPYALAAEAVR